MAALVCGMSSVRHMSCRARVSARNRAVSQRISYRIPLGRTVDGDLCALLGASITWILERRREIDIFGYGT